MENNKRVLVIDDEAHIRRVIELKFKNQGYRVTTATNGEEGLDIIQTEQPDVVITDIMMPKMDGKSLCEQVNDLKKKRPFLIGLQPVPDPPQSKYQKCQALQPDR